MAIRERAVLGTVAACFCVTSGTAGAQTSVTNSGRAQRGDTAASHIQAAERLLTAMDAEKTARLQNEVPFTPQITTSPQVAAQLSRIRDIGQRFATYALIRPDLIKAYTATYSEAELNEITAFYQTDVGRMMRDRAPKLLSIIQAATAERLRAAQPEMMREIRESIDSQFPPGARGNNPVGPNGTYFEFQVDKRAVPLDSAGTLPYPPSLKAAGAATGEVVARLVVDTLGSVDARTVRITRSTSDDFAQAFRQQLPTIRFTPAEKNGRKVRELLLMTFKFDPRNGR